MALPFALGAVLLTVTVSGEAQDLKTIVDGVQARYQQTPHFQARFRQTSTLATLGEKQESKGKVFIRKPGMMRWEYHDPEKQVLVSDGVNFWVYTPRHNQVIVSRFGEAFRSKTPLAFLAGNGNIRDEFKVQFADNSPDSKKGDSDVFSLSLRPKAPHPSLRELKLDIRKRDYMIIRSSLIDPFGNVTDIRFAEIRVDETLPHNLFTFKIPPGVEIVHPPQTPANR
jgi:outer membrane lipoprotein carrier protein